MRITVEVLPWLSETLEGGSPRRVVLEEHVPAGTSLRQLLAELYRKHSRFGPRVFDPEKGLLTGQSELAINGTIYDLVGGLDSPLQEGDTVTFLPSLAGGQSSQ